MQKRIVLFGGSFNPPGLHHRRIAEALARQFDLVVVVPCGPRPDKLTTNDVEPVARATMVDMTFEGLSGVRVDLFDLEQATFTRTHDLQSRYEIEGEVWHEVGADLLTGGATCDSEIQRNWKHGGELWKTLNFAVVLRPGYTVQTNDLPPRYTIIECDFDAASRGIRERVLHRQPFADLVVPRVADYIDRYGLYRSVPRAATGMSFSDGYRPYAVVDAQSRAALDLASELAEWDGVDATSKDLNCIVVIGGDGTMLQAIREHWRRRLPFLGLNTGHRGFLLNRLEQARLPQEVILHRSPLLYVETLDEDERWHETLGCNDAWVQAPPGTTGWIEVAVDGRVRIQKLIGDGVLVATAAGSTAYARAMGATPIPVGTRQMLLVGSNVLEPPLWHNAALPLEAEVCFSNLDPSAPRKRPLLGFVDGIRQGRRVQEMRIRASRIAEVELAFLPGNDLATKLLQMQFPSFL